MSRIGNAPITVPAGVTVEAKDNVITVEDIQDSAEVVLIQAGYVEVAKSYILYRKQREKVRNIGDTLVDYKKVVDDYLKVADWRVKENSTVTYSVGGLILSNSGAVTANYWLSEVYVSEIGEAHRNADIKAAIPQMPIISFPKPWKKVFLLFFSFPGAITSCFV